MLAWIEWFCIHGPGDVEGRPLHPDRGADALPLDDELAGLILDCYCHDETGRRLYDAALVSRAKGRAKSEWAALIGLAEAFAPARFDGWAEGGEVYRWRDFVYRYEPGEPMGRRITYPYIRCLATEEGQVGHTFDNIYFNLTEGPLSEDLPKDAAGITRVYLPDGGEIRPSTASSAAKDGGKETLAIFDEPHLYRLPELRRMYQTVTRNLRKRRAAAPWALATSTMYQPGEDSIAERLHTRAKLIKEGKTRETRLLFDHREAPADVDLTDMDAMLEALREVYGPFADAIDLRGIVEAEFWNVEKDVEDSRRYFFNQPTAAVDAWVTHPEWQANANADASLALEDGETVALFFDGSKSDDSTGLLACRISDGAVFVIGAWEREQGAAGDGWEVDRADVDRVVRLAFDKLDPVAFFGDVKEFESYIDVWANDFKDRLLVDATVGKYAHAVAFDMRARVQEFTAATERALVDIREREFPHPDDPRLTRHALNARRSPNRYGVTVSKKGRESPDKIDLIVCAIGARMARRIVLASPAWKNRKKKRSGRIW